MCLFTAGGGITSARAHRAKTSRVTDGAEITCGRVMCVVCSIYATKQGTSAKSGQVLEGAPSLACVPARVANAGRPPPRRERGCARRRRARRRIGARHCALACALSSRSSHLRSHVAHAFLSARPCILHAGSCSGGSASHTSFRVADAFEKVQAASAREEPSWLCHDLHSASLCHRRGRL